MPTDANMATLQAGYMVRKQQSAWHLPPSASQPDGVLARVQNKHRAASGQARIDGSPFTLSAYRSVLRVCSQESPFGETLAIITVRASSPTKLSRKTCGSRYLEGQKPLLGCQQHLHLKPLAS